MRNIAVLLGDPSKADKIKLSGRFNPEDLEVVERLKQALGQLKDYRFVYLDDHDHLFRELIELHECGRMDYVFNLCDEGLNNNPRLEAAIPSRLDELGIKYTGSDKKCLEVCFDKRKVKEIVRKIGVPIAKEYNLGEEIKYPVIVKPSKGDGSFGINQKSVAKNNEELKNAIKNLRNIVGDDEILIEEFISGDEITQGIIGNGLECLMLPLIKEDYSKLPKNLPQICGYEAKWDPNSEYWNCLNPIPANVAGKTKEMIKHFSKDLFKILGCRDYARFDWRINGFGMPKFLEANPNPGWCYDGHLAKASGIAGIQYSEMLEKILKAAEKRFSL